MALNFPPSDASPWTAPNGVIYTWNTDGYWEAKADPADLDGEYLKLDASNDPVTGTCEFSGGVKVTGGNLNTLAVGQFAACIKTHDDTELVPADMSGATPVNVYGNNIGSINVRRKIDGDTPDASGKTYNAFCTFLDIEESSNITTFNNFQATGYVEGLKDFTGALRGYTADYSLDEMSISEDVIGFESELRNKPGVYNFYARHDAPNFFQGNTYIGGTTARNTFELWKSTLTEEQKEQLAAGTFAIPANVSVPGDGSFVRQWWYDQQSAEDQALIDAGELEYPSRFQAANFVDTFELGVTTNINLLSNGRGEFKSAKSSSLILDGPDSSNELFNGSGAYGMEGYEGINFVVNDKRIFRLYKDSQSLALDSDPIVSSTSRFSQAFAITSSPRVAADGKRDGDAYRTIASFIEIDNNVCDSNYNIVAIAATDDPAKTYTAFHADDTNFGSGVAQKLASEQYGYYSNFSLTDERSYNFYAEGSAPNYFAGKSTFGKTICVGPNGANDDNFPDGMSSSALRVYANASSSTDPKNAPIVVTGGKVLSSSPKHILTYLGGKTEVGGSIIAAASTGDLSFVNPSDYRLKTNIQSVTENASDKIKNLNVVSYTDRFGNLIPRGFVAHELQEECSEAVFGTKDATEAIGTLADYNGISP